MRAWKANFAINPDGSFSYEELLRFGEMAVMEDDSCELSAEEWDMFARINMVNSPGWIYGRGE